MITIYIPDNKKSFQIENLILDYNGTLAVDGKLLPEVKDLLIQLSDKLNIHIITADTFGIVRSQIEGIPCKLTILQSENQAQDKLNYLSKINPDSTICIGNGRNDRLMLKEAAIGIAVIQKEGIALDSLLNADIACSNIVDALELLINPLRITATLRN